MKFKTLQEFLIHYESLNYFAGYGFTTNINNIEKLSETDLLIKKYESLAFGFQPSHNSENNNRGTYYGPFMSYTGEDGNYYEYPSIDLIDQDCIKYRWDRLNTTTSNFMKYTYANLIYDFSPKILKKDASIILDKNYKYTTGNCVIDCGIEILNTDILEHDVMGKIYIERMIDISIKIGNNRITEIIETCISYEDKIAKDELPGLRGFSYDYLIKDKKVVEFLSEKQKKRIVKNIENRLQRLLSNNGKIRSIKNCITRLLDYYEGDEDKTIKLLDTLEQEYRKDEYSNKTPLQIQNYLEEIKDLYYYYNQGNRFGEKINKLIKEIKEIGKRVSDSMQTFHTEFFLTDDEIRQEVSKYFNLEEKKIILDTFISGFIHNKKNTFQRLELLIKKHPILFLSKGSIFDKNGIVVLQLPSVNEDIEPHLIQQYQQEISLMNVFLNEVCDHIKNNYTIENNLLNSEIIRTLIREETLKTLWRHYLEGNNLEFCHMAIPLIESIFRYTLEKIGGTDIKPNNVGGYDKKSFGHVLFDPLLQESFGESFIFYFRVLFIERAGFNLRNNLAHGIHIDNFNSQGITNRIFHSLLCLSTIQFQNIE